MPLNASQVSYAMKRVSDIAAIKVARLKDKYPQRTELSPSERSQAISTGKAKFKGISIHDYTDVTAAFTFPTSLSKAEAMRNAKAAEEAQARIERKAANLRDQLMLGDAEGAMKLIEAFEKE